MNEKEARNKTEKKIERQQELMLLCLSNQEFNDCKKCGQYKEICPFQRKIDDLEQALKDGETKERERTEKAIPEIIKFFCMVDERNGECWGMDTELGTVETLTAQLKELLAKIRGDDSPTTTGRIQ